jgi:hypothetical protein
MSPMYTVAQITAVLDNGLSFTLSEEVANNITTLATDMGLKMNRVAEHVVIPRQVQSSEDTFVRRKEPVSSIPRPVGLEAVIATIRLTLNKMTAKTSITARDTIAQIVEDTIQSTPEHLHRVVHYILELASINKMNSLPSAEMVHYLQTNSPQIKPIITDYIGIWTERYETVKYVDPDEDYDEYCVINAQNLQRRSQSLFLTNLVRVGTKPMKLVLDIICKLLNLIDTNKASMDHRFINNEWIENVAILCSENMGAGLSDDEQEVYVRIQEYINALAVFRTMSASERPDGIGSKLICSVINIMEIIDI